MGRLRDLARLFVGGSEPFATPAVTRPQQLALGQAVVAVLVAFGFNLDTNDRELIIGLAAALAAVLPLSDALVRRSRAENISKIDAAQRREAEAGQLPSVRLVELLDELERT